MSVQPGYLTDTQAQDYIQNHGFIFPSKIDSSSCISVSVIAITIHSLSQATYLGELQIYPSFELPTLNPLLFC